MVMDNKITSVPPLGPVKVPKPPSVLEEPSSDTPVQYWNKPYITDSSVILAKTQNTEIIYGEGIRILDSIWKSLELGINDTGYFNSFSTITDESQRDIFIRHMKEVGSHVNEILSITPLNPDEEKALQTFNELLITYANFTEVLSGKEELDETTENLIRANLFHMQDYFERVNEWMNDSDILEKYALIKSSQADLDAIVQEILSSDIESSTIDEVLTEIQKETAKAEPLNAISSGLASTPEVFVKKLTVNEFPKEATFTGKIWKDKEEGNGVYIYNFRSLLNEKGDQKAEPFRNEIVTLQRFNDFSDLPERKSGQIDIELPVDTAQFKAGQCIVLPTHLGYRATAISFCEAQDEKVIIEQNPFGLTILKNLDPNVKTIRYRLEKTKLKPIKDIPGEWSTHFETTNKKPGDDFIEGAIKQHKGFKQKVDLIKAQTTNTNPVYSTNKDIQEILKEVKNYFEAQKELGLMGHCEHMAVYLANEFRKNGIPAIVVGGNVTGVGPEGLSFRSDAGHSVVLYFDERGVPHIEDATLLADKNCSLNETQVALDKKDALKVISSATGNVTNHYLSKRVSAWRVFSKQSSNSDFQSTVGTREYREKISTDQFISKPKQNYKDAYEEVLRDCRQKAYKEVISLEKAKEEWQESLEKGNLKKALNSLGLIHACVNQSHGDIYTYLNYIRTRGVVDTVLPKVLNSTDPEKYADEFLQWFNSHNDVEKEKLQKELLDFLTKPEEYKFIYELTYSNTANAILPLLNKKEILELPIDKLEQFQRLLQSSHLNKDLKVKWLEEITCKIREIKLAQKEDLDESQIKIKQQSISQYPPLSPVLMANTCNLLRFHDEEYIEEAVIDAVLFHVQKNEPEKLKEILTVYHESGALSKYVSITDKGPELTSHLKEKIVLRCKEGFIKKSDENKGHDLIKHEKYPSKTKIFDKKGNDALGISDYKWDFHLDIPALLKNLETLGIDLRAVITPDIALSIIKRDFFHIQESVINTIYQITQGTYKPPEVTHDPHSSNNMNLYNQDGSLKLENPASLVLSMLGYNRWSPSKNAVNARYFCNYFQVPQNRLPITYRTDEDIWEKEVKPKLGDLLTKITDLPEDVFQEIVDKNSELKIYLERSSLLWKPTEPSIIVSALIKKHPEARELIIKTFEEKIRIDSGSRVTKDLIEINIPESTKYRYILLLDMFLPRDSNTCPPALKENLNKAFETANGDYKSPAFEESLRNAFRLTFLNSPNWAEIRNELYALSQEELKTFSATLCESEFKFTFKNILQGDLMIIMPPNKKTELSEEYKEKELTSLNISEKSFNYVPAPYTLALRKILDLSSQERIQKTQSYFERDLEIGEFDFRILGIYPKRGVELVTRVANLKSNSYWCKKLTDMVTSMSKPDEVNYLSCSGEYFKAAEQASNDLRNVNPVQTSLFGNGQVQYIKRSGSSSMFAKATRGDFHSLRKASSGDKKESVNWRASSKTGDGSLVINEYREQTDPNPYHFIVDLEWIQEGSSKGNISENMRNLVSVLCTGIANRQKQYLHISYMGNMFFSIRPHELKDMLSSKKINDDFGERTNRTDFILQLNYLAACAKKTVEYSQSQSGYNTDHIPISNTLWIPPTREGTAFVLPRNEGSLSASMNLFRQWIKRHIDVRRLSFE